MVQRRTNNGQLIDFDSMIAGDEIAVGNMRVNARGDVIGANGEIVTKSEDRVRAYYEDNPNSSTATTSTKGPMPDVEHQVKTDMAPEVKTANAQQTEADQSVMGQTTEPVVEERVIASYKEVELPNGDIEMVPVYEDDWEDNA
tara:strand:+ start:7845 stop:8273 length:429 start_codon:yes stop_codon:yes gene_type:complete